MFPLFHRLSEYPYKILVYFRVNLEEHVFGATKPNSYSNSTTDDSSVELMPLIVSRETCVIVFAALTILIIIATLAETVLLVSVCTTASTNLHNQMFTAITRSTMNFLNKNPSGKKIFFFNFFFLTLIVTFFMLGRILNRFSKDIGLIDEILPNILVDVIQVRYNIINFIVENKNICIFYYTLLDGFDGHWDVCSCGNCQSLFNHSDHNCNDGFF